MDNAITIYKRFYWKHLRHVTNTACFKEHFVHCTICDLEEGVNAIRFRVTYLVSAIDSFLT